MNRRAFFASLLAPVIGKALAPKLIDAAEPSHCFRPSPYGLPPLRIEFVGDAMMPMDAFEAIRYHGVKFDTMRITIGESQYRAISDVFARARWKETYRKRRILHREEP